MAERATTVLVAEDEALIRMDLVELLTELGYQVVGQVADGQAAVDRTRELLPDVVFMDVAMPRRDGLSAAEEILSEGWAPVVMVTAFSQQEMVRRAADAGVMGYLVKPFGRSDLVPAIEVAVARWQQMRALSDQVRGQRERREAREVVEQAKSLLQERLGLGEPEAFAWLRRAAMDARVTLAEAAARVVADDSSSDETAGRDAEGA
ncbi:MAG TPA: response regulator [Actinobacteria bacterium]|nr:response regulator [Actinomycetota bacterium]